MDKYEFSKEDYLLCKKIFGKEIDTGKIVSIDSVNNKHDKIFKNILTEEKEIRSFLKGFVELDVENIKLEECKNTFITQNFKKRKSDIIYKNEKEEIYYIIEHQSTVDKRMPIRILEYCIEVMRDIEKSGKLEKDYNPLIIPIVIYTGNKKWNIATNFSETQRVKEKYKEYAINLKYKLIDINKYSKQELLKKDTKIASMMLIEKYNTSKEISNILIELISKTKDKEIKEWIEGEVLYILKDTLTTEKQKEILELLKKGEKGSMEEWLERVRKNDARIERNLIKKGEQKGRTDGIIEGIMTIVKNMLKNNMDDESIMKYTNVKKEEIEKARKELANS